MNPVDPIDDEARRKSRVAALAEAAHKPRPAGKVDARLVSLTSPMTFEAEQYRNLCYVLNHKKSQGDLSILAVSGASVGDGKTTTALNLTATFAQDPALRILIVDADLRRPSVSRRVGLAGDLRGLVELVSDPRLALSDVLVQRTPWSFFIIPAGKRPEDPYRVLSSPRFAEIVRAAREHFDWIILDCPPLLAVPDARVIGDCVDGFLLVVGASRTPRKLVEETLNEIEPGKVCGIVLNCDRRILSGYSKYYRAYGYTTSVQDEMEKKAGTEAA